MDERHVRRAMLFAALALVALTTLTLRWSPGTGDVRLLPLHLDEYFHWGYAQEAVREGTISFGDPFTGSPPAAFDPAQHLHERGFHAYLGAFQDATGLPWATIMGYGPMVLSLLVTVAVYAVARSWGAGAESALLMAALPTTMRFLGPGLLVPVNLALFLVLAGVLVFLSGRDAAGLSVLAVISIAIWPIHVLGGLWLLALVTLLAGFLAVRAPGRSATAILILAVPALMAVPAAIATLGHANAGAEDLPSSVEEWRRLGWIPLALACAGVVLMVGSSRPHALARVAGSALGVALLACAAIIVHRAETGADPTRTYDRMILAMGVLAALLGGAALARLRMVAMDHRARSGLRVAALVLLIGTSTIVIHDSFRARSEIAFVEIATSEQFTSYEEAARLPSAYDRAVVDGPATMAFTVATGRPTLHVVYPTSGATPAYLETFFREGANDTYLLVETRTSIVVTHRPVTNPDLEPIAPGVYALRQDILARMGPAP